VRHHRGGEFETITPGEYQTIIDNRIVRVRIRDDEARLARSVLHGERDRGPDGAADLGERDGHLPRPVISRSVYARPEACGNPHAWRWRLILVIVSQRRYELHRLSHGAVSKPKPDVSPIDLSITVHVDHHSEVVRRGPRPAPPAGNVCARIANEIQRHVQVRQVISDEQDSEWRAVHLPRRLRPRGVREASINHRRNRDVLRFSSTEGAHEQCTEDGQRLDGRSTPMQCARAKACDLAQISTAHGLLLVKKTTPGCEHAPSTVRLLRVPSAGFYVP